MSGVEALRTLVASAGGAEGADCDAGALDFVPATAHFYLPGARVTHLLEGDGGGDGGRCHVESAAGRRVLLRVSWDGDDDASAE